MQYWEPNSPTQKGTCQVSEKLPAFRLLYVADLLFVIPVAAGLNTVVVKHLILAGISAGTEAGDNIVVGKSIPGYRQRSLQTGKIMAVGVAFYEDDVAFVNLSDPVHGCVDDAVEGPDSRK